MRLIDLFEQLKTLDEVRMDPSAFKRWLSSPAAEGMLMGIEFEMYVPYTTGGGSGEYNYDNDNRVYDIDDVATFFQDTEGYNYIDRKLKEQYYEWLTEAVDDYIERNWDEGTFREKIADQFNVNDYWDEAKDQLESDRDEDSEEDIDEDEIEERARELMDSAIDQCIADQDSTWESAYDEYREELQGDSESDTTEGDWLESLGVAHASDAEREFGFAWPHFDDEEEGPDVDQVASELSSDLGLNVVSGGSYHSVRRESGKWIVEPDSSLDSPGDRGYAGVEVVSPPVPVAEMVDEMNRIWNWASDNNCHTNKTTGLHMNVSVPDFSIEKLDFIKLAIFMGDTYILEQFGRVLNNYCKSAMRMIRSRAKDARDVERVLEMMRTSLNTGVSKIIHQGRTDKYTSINTHEGYVEFRGPGGDWLSKTPEELSATMLRLAMALSIACDENAYRQEYAKKFYKLMSPQSENADVIALFARYASGTINADSLKNVLRSRQGERESEKLIKSGVKITYNVSLSATGQPNPYNFTVEAAGKQDAARLAKEMGEKYEPDESMRSYWKNATINDLVIVEGDAPDPSIKRTLFTIIESDGKRTTLAFRNMDQAYKFVTRIRADVWKHARGIKDLTTGDVRLIERPEGTV